MIVSGKFKVQRLGVSHKRVENKGGSLFITPIASKRDVLFVSVLVQSILFLGALVSLVYMSPILFVSTAGLFVVGTLIERDMARGSYVDIDASRGVVLLSSLTGGATIYDRDVVDVFGRMRFRYLKMGNFMQAGIVFVKLKCGSEKKIATLKNDEDFNLVMSKVILAMRV